MADMASSNKTMVTALFKDGRSAELAFEAVLRRGYRKEDVNFMMDADTHERYTAPKADKSGGGIELGGPSSGTVQTIVTALTAVGAALLRPGLGLVVAGPVSAALAGAGAAALTGGVFAAFHDWGIPNERIAAYEAGLKAGGVLMGVVAKDAEDAAHIAQEWQAVGGERVRT